MIAVNTGVPGFASAQVGPVPTPLHDRWVNVTNHDVMQCTVELSDWQNVDSATRYHVKLIRYGQVVAERTADGMVTNEAAWEVSLADRTSELRCEITGTNAAGSGPPQTVRPRIYPALPGRKDALAVLRDVAFPKVGFAPASRRELQISPRDASAWTLHSSADGLTRRNGIDLAYSHVQFFGSARSVRDWYGRGICARVARAVRQASRPRRMIKLVWCRPTKLAGAEAAMTWVTHTRWTNRVGVPMTTVSVETYGRTWYGTFLVVGERDGRAARVASNTRAVLRFQVPLRQRVALRTSQE